MTNLFSPISLLNETFILGESPVWDSENNRLYWTDIIGQNVHSLDIKTQNREVWNFSTEVGALGLTDQNRLIVATRKDIFFLHPKTGKRDFLCRIEDNLNTRTNDGKVGPDGAFWIGTMNNNISSNEPLGSLYRITNNGTVEKKATGFKISNGLSWSSNGKIMYHSDSRGPWVNKWDFNITKGTINNCQRYLNLDDNIGRPDGSAVDSEDCYWSAGVSSGTLNRFSPDGNLLKSINMLIPNPTMPCFGGKNMKTLYVTSHRYNYTLNQCRMFPNAGKIFTLEVEVPGVPISRFHEKY